MKLRTRDIIEQIRHGNIPDGYKKTKAGILPVDWNVHMLRDCLQRIERPVEVEPNELYTQIGIRSHGKGLFYKEPVTGEALGNKSVFWIEPDCFIVNIVFAWEQAIGKTTQSEIGMIGSHRFPMYRPVNDRVDINYLIYYFLTKRGTNILEAASPGGAGRNKTLGQNRFLKSKIILPSIEEQQKIAAILMTQDKVIELKEKHLTEKQQQKKYLMQQLLTGKKRLHGFCGEWKKTKLKNILYERKTYSTKGLEYPHVTLSTQGIFPKNERYDRDHLVRDEDKEYKITHKGDICYNPANLKFGVICENTFGDAIFSPIYVTFEVRKNVCREYLANYVMRWDFINAVRKYEEGTVYERMAVKPEDFLKFEISLPQIEEQIAIAEVLSAADQEMDLLRQDIEQEIQKKKALMQLLLTGIVRVKV
ncbi:restriction endonuclease subunit S [Lachnoclostridium sp. An196]|uniref:restriction endonuclease subunit S n=1 Tax=Lachnoclostridium sp. An196 TaxID=1965583 RepID=UPI00117A34CB|nr:restriction endonuclease subunit S [Lachnoclostridium sp. An196]